MLVYGYGSFHALLLLAGLFGRIGGRLDEHSPHEIWELNSTVVISLHYVYDARGRFTDVIHTSRNAYSSDNASL